jgi:hypothetical protein
MQEKRDTGKQRGEESGKGQKQYQKTWGTHEDWVVKCLRRVERRFVTKWWNKKLQVDWEEEDESRTINLESNLTTSWGHGEGGGDRRRDDRRKQKLDRAGEMRRKTRKLRSRTTKHEERNGDVEWVAGSEGGF